MLVRAKRLGWNEGRLGNITDTDILDPYDYRSDDLEGELIKNNVSNNTVNSYVQYVVNGQIADPTTITEITDTGSPATVSSGGAAVTLVVDPPEVKEDLGGAPNPGTKPDKRLKTNKPKPAKSSDTEGEETLAVQPTEVDAEGFPPPTWRGVLTVEGTPTGDRREFAPDSLTWADVPLPLRWQKVDSHGGMPSNETVNVGTITRVWREGADIMGEGTFDLGGPEDDDAHEAFRRMNSNPPTLSGISIDADDITDADIEYVMPEPDEDEEDDIFFLLFAEPEKIIFHAARIRAATLVDIPAFVEAKIGLISEDDEQIAASVSALVAHAWHDEWRPPAGWFDDPKLNNYTPILVTDQGRVYGHAAPWGQCHLGFMNECITPPHETHHSYYLTGEVICEDGSHVAVGQITAGLEHAPLSARAARAKEHYENTDAVIADVVVGNDTHGIWVAGAIRPDANNKRVNALRASGQVSPDWRRIGGELRMIGLLTVNESGYIVPKVRTLTAGGQMQSMVASGLMPVRPPHADKLSDEDLEQLALKKLRERLFARVHGKD